MSRFNRKYSASIFLPEGNLYANLHEETARKLASAQVARLLPGFHILLGYGIGGIGIKTPQTDSRDGHAVIVIHLIGEDHSLTLIPIDIHQRGYTFSIIGVLQAIEITRLHRLAQFLIVGKAGGTLQALLVVHVLGLEFDAKTSTHRHVATELDGGDAPTCVPIRHTTDMLCHRIGREEVARAILDVDALQGIGII